MMFNIGDRVVIKRFDQLNHDEKWRVDWEYWGYSGIVTANEYEYEIEILIDNVPQILKDID